MGETVEERAPRADRLSLEAWNHIRQAVLPDIVALRPTPRVGHRPLDDCHVEWFGRPHAIHADDYAVFRVEKEEEARGQGYIPWAEFGSSLIDEVLPERFRRWTHPDHPNRYFVGGRISPLKDGGEIYTVVQTAAEAIDG